MLEEISSGNVGGGLHRGAIMYTYWREMEWFPGRNGSHENWIVRVGVIIQQNLW